MEIKTTKNDSMRFMCLEDRCLVTLYNQPGFVPMENIASSISITENALLSIIHRITESYPDYMIVQGEETNGFLLSPNLNQEKEVKVFLAEGGFTAINEQEFREYYRTEMENYTKLERLKSTLEQHRWIKWVAGVSFTVGASLALAALLKSLKK